MMIEVSDLGHRSKEVKKRTFVPEIIRCIRVKQFLIADIQGLI